MEKFDWNTASNEAKYKYNVVHNSTNKIAEQLVKNHDILLYDVPSYIDREADVYSEGGYLYEMNGDILFLDGFLFNNNVSVSKLSDTELSEYGISPRRVVLRMLMRLDKTLLENSELIDDETHQYHPLLTKDQTLEVLLGKDKNDFAIDVQSHKVTFLNHDFKIDVGVDDYKIYRISVIEDDIEETEKEA